MSGAEGEAVAFDEMRGKIAGYLAAAIAAGQLDEETADPALAWLDGLGEDSKARAVDAVTAILRFVEGLEGKETLAGLSFLLGASASDG